MSTGRGEFGYEDIPAAVAPEHRASKSRGLCEASGHQDVARRVNRHAQHAAVSLPESLGPDVSAGGGELRQEHVARSDIVQRPTSEIDRAVEVPCRDDVAAGIHRNAGAEIIAHVTKA